MPNWREICEPVLKNWSEPHKGQMLAALARENDYAESLGFTCELDKRRGFGYCSFSNGATRVLESIGKKCGVLCCWLRYEVNSDGCVEQLSRKAYTTLRDALADENIIAKCIGGYDLWELTSQKGSTMPVQRQGR